MELAETLDRAIANTTNFKRVEDDLDTLRSRIKKLKHTTEFDEDIFKDVIGDIKKQINDINLTLSSHNSQLMKDHKDIVKLKSNVDDLNKKVKTLEDFSNGVNERFLKIEEMEKQLREIQEDMKKLANLEQQLHSAVRNKQILHNTYRKDDSTYIMQTTGGYSVSEILNMYYNNKNFERVLQYYDKMSSTSLIIPLHMSMGLDDFSIQMDVVNGIKYDVYVKFDRDKKTMTLNVNYNDNGIYGTVITQIDDEMYPVTTVLLLRIFRNTVNDTYQNRVQLMVYTDAQNIYRALNHENYAYSDDDIIFKHDISQLSNKRDYTGIKTKYDGMMYLSFSDVHYGNIIDIEGLHRASLQMNYIISYAIDEYLTKQRNELENRIEKDGMFANSELFHTVASLSMQLSNLIAVAVRAISADAMINNGAEMKLNLTAIPKVHINRRTALPDYNGGGIKSELNSGTDTYGWWRRSDNYISNRKWSFVFDNYEDTVSSKMSLLINLVSDDSLSSTTIPCHMDISIDHYPQYGDASIDMITPTTKRWDSFFLHVPFGRDEIASDNDNSDIFNRLSMRPNYFGFNSTVLWTNIITTTKKSSMYLSIKIYPADSLPLTSVITQGKNIQIEIYDGEKLVAYDVDLIWKNYTITQNGINRLVFEGTGILTQNLPDLEVVTPVGNISVGRSAADNSTVITRKWNAKGPFESAEMQLGDTFCALFASVASPIGGKSIATSMNIALSQSRRNLPTATLPRPIGSNVIQVLNRGMVCNGKPLSIIIPPVLLTVRYIRDPLGVGSIAVTNYDIADLSKRLQDLQSQLIDLQTLIDSVDKRLKLVENAVFNSQSSLLNALTILSMAASYINPLAGVTMSILTTVYSITEMVHQGVTAENVTFLITNMIDMLAGIASVSKKPPGWITQSGKYDVANAAAQAEKQKMTLVMEKFKRLDEDDSAITQSNTLMKSHTVQVMAQPIDAEICAPKFMKKVLERINNGTATQVEKTAFDAFSSMKINPTHQFLRMSNVEHTAEGKVKHVWIFGVGDGYADEVERYWLGTRTKGIIPRDTPGWLGPGVFKMKFKLDETGEWSLLPARSSDMNSEEILIAGGASYTSAQRLKEQSTIGDYNLAVENAYKRTVDKYVFENQAVVIKDKNMQIMDGQLDSLLKLIKGSYQDKFKYSFVGNNCQNYVDDILKMLKNPLYHPPWMRDSDYLQYINELNDNFGKYTN